MRYAILLLAAVALAQDVKVQNEKVKVVEATLAPGRSAAASDAGPVAVVFLNNSGTAKKGEVRFFEPGHFKLDNAGKSELRYARIDFLGKGLEETWGRTGISPNYKVLLENQYARVYDIHIAAGTKEPQHTHHDRIVICFSGANMIHLLPDGRTETSTLKTGEIAWRRGATHVGNNLDTVDFWAVAIEPK
jgi:hypothetical protein